MPENDLLSLVQERLNYFNVKVAHVHTETALEPDYGNQIEQLSFLHPKIIEALRNKGINKLYKFQEESVRKILGGKNLLIISGTGTGKTEAFLIPALQFALEGRRSVLVYPTKALARDQLKRIGEFSKEIDVKVGVFDGDTSEKEREKMYSDPPDILITNPDMIHVGLSLSYRFRSLVRGAELFVFDEVHTYEGVLGAHVRMIVDRLRDFGDIQVVGSSGTMDASPYLFPELFGVEGEIVKGTLRRRGIAIHALLDIGSASRWTISAYLASILIKEGLKVLVFTDSQQMAELIAKISSRFGAEVFVHRAGIRKEERKTVEEGIREGKIKGIAATSTLELGIDIGDLDAVILAQNPPNFAKYLQRAGRAGRRNKPGYIFTLLGSDPIDSYYLRRPKEFFERKLTPLAFDTSNLEVVKIHAAAYLLEKGRIRTQSLPSLWLRAFRELEREKIVIINGETILPTQKLIWFVKRSHIRSTGPIITIYDQDGKVVGERELPVGLYDIYPQAVYLISRHNYVVQSMDIDKLKAIVKRVNDDIDFYTKPIYSSHLMSLEEIEERKVYGLPVKYGAVTIMEVIEGYAIYELVGRKDRPKKEVYYDEPITFTYETKGLLIKHPILPEFNEIDAMEAFHATEHVLISAARVTAGAGLTDLSGISYPSGHVVIYDSVVGGSGVTKLLFERLEDAYMIAKDITENCDCEDGCPKCIYSPFCGNNNKVLSRRKSFRLIKTVTENRIDEKCDNLSGRPIA
ncbi:DEAD/DEAH box helicase [Stygiolobus caldivivus]|uniref:DEAD/DEAH box helicase n=1 Tax=Stygiolobus caldivivus TaxID=2824673 RepID=A0A8D5U5T1_9CREN|nr:DEAD/DEAH box helicase [Stygiolobus caldivivus]BCU69399.1 DEAD/DEAH box helicase [Stygiolobus caldivivus]